MYEKLKVFKWKSDYVSPGSVYKFCNHIPLSFADPSDLLFMSPSSYIILSYAFSCKTLTDSPIF